MHICIPIAYNPPPRKYNKPCYYGGLTPESGVISQLPHGSALGRRRRLCGGEGGAVVVAINKFMEPLRLLRKWCIGNQ